MRKCSSLKKNEQVVFRTYSDIFGRKIYETGSVIYVLPNSKTVAVSYLDGYRSATEDIPYEDMVACYDDTGNYMEFDNIKGRSVFLSNE